ncbi:hypothetical protein ACJX0J_040365 [Zea mays]
MNTDISPDLRAVLKQNKYMFSKQFIGWCHVISAFLIVTSAALCQGLGLDEMSMIMAAFHLFHYLLCLSAAVIYCVSPYSCALSVWSNTSNYVVANENQSLIEDVTHVDGYMGFTLNNLQLSVSAYGVLLYQPNKS